MIIVGLLIPALLFAGCQTQSRAEEKTEPSAVLPNQDFSVEILRRVNLPLYFSDISTQRVLTQMREVFIGDNESVSEAAVGELIKGPLTKDLYSVIPPGTRLLSLEISKNVANIDFSVDFLELTPDEQMVARVALACTLYELERVEYVNIFIEGKLLGYRGKPLGLVNYRRYSGDLDSLFAKMQMEPEDNTLPQNYSVALYFPDASNQYLLPQVRQISMVQDDSITAIVDELRKGPVPAAGVSAPVLIEGMVLADKPSVIVNITGKKTVVLNFASIPQNDGQNADAYALRLGALVYSIMSFMPDVENVTIKNNAEVVYDIPGLAFKDGLMTRSDFSVYLGNSITIYLKKQNAQQLSPVYRSVQQEDADSAASRVSEIIHGPLSSEQNVSPLFPGNVTQQDLLGVKINQDIAYVNFTESFYGKCAQLSQQDESLLAYAVINTLAQIPGVKRVQFLSSGNPRDYLAKSIYIKNPLMSNPGIVEVNKEKGA